MLSRWSTVKFSLVLNLALGIFVLYPREITILREAKKSAPVDRQVADSGRSKAATIVDVGNIADVKIGLIEAGYSDYVVKEVIRAIAAIPYNDAVTESSDRAIARMRRWNRSPRMGAEEKKAADSLFATLNAATGDAVLDSGYVERSRSRGLAAISDQLSDEKAAAVLRIESKYERKFRESADLFGDDSVLKGDVGKQLNQEYVAELAGVLEISLLGRYLDAAFPPSGAVASLLGREIQLDPATTASLVALTERLRQEQLLAGDEGHRRKAVAEAFVAAVREKLGDGNFVLVSKRLDAVAAEADTVYGANNLPIAQRADLFEVAFRARRAIQFGSNGQEKREVAAAAYSTLRNAVPESMRASFDETVLARELKANSE